MTRKAPRSDNSLVTKVVLLAKFGFDYLDDMRLIRTGKDYRLMRERDNIFKNGGVPPVPNYTGEIQKELHLGTNNFMFLILMCMPPD